MSSFIDEAVVLIMSGKGGSGSASFHREKHVPRGGPNGADGGRGGDIWLQAENGKRTLLDFRLQRQYQAGHGTNARQNKSGSDGQSMVLLVPLGTSAIRVDSGEVLCDLAQDGSRFRLARGGRGGRGNLHFTNSVRQSPGFAEHGEPSESFEVRLELKLLADVGLIGLPNAGKSTLVSACSAARPRIAAYPFTTLVPNLGVVRVDDKSFVMADMPGLIEGASEGHGLGHQFLKHIERTRVLIHVVDLFPVDESDPLTNYEVVERELKQYSEELAARPRIIALNKADLEQPEVVRERALPFSSLGPPVFVISAATSMGTTELERAALLAIEHAEKSDPTIVVRPPLVESKVDDSWSIEPNDYGFALRGTRLERWVAMTDQNNREALRMLHLKLDRIGVIKRLRELGATEGDTVSVGDWEFTYVEN